jgi:hypothetical protein
MTYIHYITIQRIHQTQAFDIQRWATGMGKRGWNLNRLHRPNAVHLCLTAATAGAAQTFIDDSKAVCEALLGIYFCLFVVVVVVGREFVHNCIFFSLADEKLYADGSAAIYGMAAQLPGALQNVLVTDLVKSYLDIIV